MDTEMKGIAGIFVAVLLSVFLTACGGGSGGPSSSPTVIAGKFINISGLGYNSGSQAGTTGATGTFSYLAGETAKFKVGDIIIGQSTARSLLTPLHLFPGADAATTNVVNIMRFLMSIGIYNVAKQTIVIPSAVLNAAIGKTVNFATASDQELLDLVKQLTGNSNAVLVDAPTATAFLSNLIYKFYGGLYRGSFSGPASSNNWEMTINTVEGAVTGAGLDGAKEAINGYMTNGVKFTGVASGNCRLIGKLNLPTMTLEGDWIYTDPKGIRSSQSGKFTGGLVNTP